MELLRCVRGKNVIGGDVVCLMPTVDSPNQITSYRSMAIMFEMISLIADRHHQPDDRLPSSIRGGCRAAEGAQVADASASALNRGHASAAQGRTVQCTTPRLRRGHPGRSTASCPPARSGRRCGGCCWPPSSGDPCGPESPADTPWVRALGTESGKHAVEIGEMGRDGLLQGGLTDEDGPAPGVDHRTRSSTEARARHRRIR